MTVIVVSAAMASAPRLSMSPPTPAVWSATAVTHASSAVVIGASTMPIGGTIPPATLAARPKTPMASAAGYASRLATGLMTGHRSEGEQQDGCHAELRGDRDGERFAQQRRAAEVPGERAGEHGDPAARGAREVEADRVDEERVEQQERDDREDEPTYRDTGRPTNDVRMVTLVRTNSAEHRWFETRGRRETDDDGERESRARQQREPAQQRSEHEQDERHVRARHREEMRQARPR